MQTVKDSDIGSISYTCETCPFSIGVGYYGHVPIYIFRKVASDGTVNLVKLAASNVIVIEDQRGDLGFLATTHRTEVATGNSIWFITPWTRTLPDVRELHVLMETRFVQASAEAIDQSD